MRQKSGLCAFAGVLGRAVTVPLIAAGVLTGLTPAAGAAAVPCVGMAGQQPPGGRLAGVAVLLPCSVWAVGAGIAHWDGATWTASPLPSTPGTPSLAAIRAFTASDIWAVGFIPGAGAAPGKPLIEHWDGSSWKISPESNPSDSSSELAAVTATSPTNAWAVGSSLGNPDHPNSVQNLIEHWNGTAWTRFPAVPVPGVFNALLGGGAISPASVWAVGETVVSDGKLRVKGLILHWDGTSWSQVSIPANVTSLTSVAVVSANDAWAVGTGVNDGRPVILHWDGSSWQLSPTPPVTGSAMSSVTATSASDAWAVGGVTVTGDTTASLVMHWDGTTWSVVPTPVGVTALAGVAARTPGTAWAVGGASDSGALALRLRAG